MSGGRRMKIFLISQGENEGYDTYDSAVVYAEDEEAAKRTTPAGDFYAYNEKLGVFHWWCNIGTNKEQYEPEDLCRTWATKLDSVSVEYIGEAKEGSEAGVICSSFNAG